MKFTNVIEYMKNQGGKFEAGLSEDEVKKAEIIYDIQFPPDFKEFLMIALPTSNGFYNWRDISESNVLKIKDMFCFIEDGFFFDIEHNAFWLKEWGSKPQELKEAFNVCKQELNRAPKMIPICGHRFIPSSPHEVDNPVFSIYQTDIIYYGENIIEYFKLELGMKEYKELNFDRIKERDFWVNLQQ